MKNAVAASGLQDMAVMYGARIATSGADTETRITTVEKESEKMKLVNAKEVRQIFDFEVAQGATDLFDAFDSAIENATAVDAAPVVHGRWECVYDEIMGETEVICSNCKDTRTINGCFVTTEGESCYFEDNYCHNCGAKMDGGVNSD